MKPPDPNRNGRDGRVPEPQQDGRDPDMTATQEAKLEAEIDRNLKLVYGRTLDEPVPERFLDLIAKLRDEIGPK